MPTKKEIIDELNFLSGLTSAQVRSIALGLLVITWGLLIGKFTDAEVTASMKRDLMIVGAIAIVTMVFDYLQYFCGYLSANALRKKMEREKKEEGKYNYEAASHIWRGRLFWIKQGSLAVALGWFLFVFFWYFI